MKRLFTILTLLLLTSAASAQSEKLIVIDSDSFRAVLSDALTGIPIDPIAVDSSDRACARIKMKINRMTREDIDSLEVKIVTNNALMKSKTADYETGLIIEMTAKPQTRFYLQHPRFGSSNEVTLNLEANCEYYIEAYLNQTFSIVVTSNAPNVDVFIDDNYKGQTDVNNSLTISGMFVGKHTLVTQYGGLRNSKDIEINEGSIAFFQPVNTEASKPQFVVFAVEPQNAVVTINGTHYAVQQGAMQTVLENGVYNYTVTATGYYPQSGTFTVAGAKIEKFITLKADSVQVTLTAPNGAEIWINGAKYGEGRWSGTLVAGTYIFEARKAGHRSASISKKITSNVAWQSYTLPDLIPITGSVVISANPIMADVALDGKTVGRTPLELNNILIGAHTLTISKDGYKPHTQKVTVTEGKSTNISATLTKVSAATQTPAVSTTSPKRSGIVIDQTSFRQIRPTPNAARINYDASLRPCARIKMKVDCMSREEIEELKIKTLSNTQVTKFKCFNTGDGLIIEMTAKPNSRFYLHHPRLGDSNEVTLNLEANREYYIEACLQ